MTHLDIECIFLELFRADNIPTDDSYFYSCKPLSSGGRITGYSLYVFGTLALRIRSAGKWKDHIEVTSSMFLQLSAECTPEQLNGSTSSNDFYRIPTQDAEFMRFVIGKIYAVCKQFSSTEFDCCHLFEQCSDARACVQTNKKLMMQCRYRHKLEKGIIYYGKNAISKSNT